VELKNINYALDFGFQIATYLDVGVTMII